MPRIGAHCGGSIRTALTRAQEIGAEAIQIFASSPHMWRSPKHAQPDVEAFVAARSAANVTPLFLHGVYLVNLASPNETFVTKSIQSIREHLRCADELGAAGLIIHVGSAGKEEYAVAEDRVIAAMQHLREDLDRRNAKLLLETCAGQGATIGRTFQELRQIIDRMDGHPNIGVCLDTCHVFAAGYPLQEADGAQRVISEFDAAVGLERLQCFHVNDSKGAFGSNVDRHANIGEGLLGEATFGRLLARPELRDLPFILEVPGEGDGPDRENVDRLKRLRSV